MIHYYTNRELSTLFQINLAKWKRWSREFLPPDPLGGRQSGYARQYHADQAFMVLLGGHLVKDLKFSIPEAKHILMELNPWLLETGFLSLKSSEKTPITRLESLVLEYKIYIQEPMNTGQGFSGFNYIYEGLLSTEESKYMGGKTRLERYIRKPIEIWDIGDLPVDYMTERVLCITRLLGYFIETLNLQKESYPVFINP